MHRTTVIVLAAVLSAMGIVGILETKARPSLLAGLADPVLGLDHFAALLVVGIWAGRLSDAARWALPGAFLGGMLLGLGLSAVEPLSPDMEPLVHLLAMVPVALIAFAIVAAVRLPRREVASTITLLGGCHGYLHSAHAGALGSGWAPASALWFSAGTLVSAAILLSLGVAVGLAVARPR